MVLSFPDLSYLPWTSSKNPKSQYPTDSIEPYCFSHWPGANCFITHFCASRKQKEKMRLTYDALIFNDTLDTATANHNVQYLENIEQLFGIDVCINAGMA